MNDWQRIHKRVDSLHAEFDGRAFNNRLRAVGKELEPLVERAVANDIGDHSMSGWRRGKPFDITGHSEPATTVPTGIFVSPALKGANWRKGHGPMRVLQDGRKAYNAGDRRRTGTRTKKKTGEVVDKFRRVKRVVGATRGKNTWDDAVALMSKGIGERVDRLAVKDILKKTWGR